MMEKKKERRKKKELFSHEYGKEFWGLIATQITFSILSLSSFSSSLWIFLLKFFSLSILLYMIYKIYIIWSLLIYYPLGIPEFFSNLSSSSFVPWYYYMMMNLELNRERKNHEYLMMRGEGREREGNHVMWREWNGTWKKKWKWKSGHEEKKGERKWLSERERERDSFLSRSLRPLFQLQTFFTCLWPFILPVI